MKLNKEFIGTVLGVEISDIKMYGNVVRYTEPNHETEEDGELVYIDLGTQINKYELMHKIKEWIVQKGEWWNAGYQDHYLGTHYCHLAIIDKFFHDYSEFQAVYKAGLYVWEMNNERN